MPILVILRTGQYSQCGISAKILNIKLYHVKLETFSFFSALYKTSSQHCSTNVHFYSLENEHVCTLPMYQIPSGFPDLDHV